MLAEVRPCQVNKILPSARSQDMSLPSQARLRVWGPAEIIFIKCWDSLVILENSYLDRVDILWNMNARRDFV